MRRSTLPAVDPLDQLGIGRARADREEDAGADATPEPVIETRKPAKAGQGRRRAASSQAPVARRTISPGKDAGGEGLDSEREHTAGTLHQLKVKFNARLPAELVDEVRNCVVALYASHRMTIDDLTADALRRELERLKKTQNAGQDFPARHVEPKVGRPVR